MQLTRYSDYSLRALIYLGLNRDRRCTIREIADAYGISDNHLMKLIHRLGRRGLHRDDRGAETAGLKLARPASEIGLGEVFRATEGNLAPGRVLSRTGDERLSDSGALRADPCAGRGPAGLSSTSSTGTRWRIFCARRDALKPHFRGRATGRSRRLDPLPG